MKLRTYCISSKSKTKTTIRIGICFTFDLSSEKILTIRKPNNMLNSNSLPTTNNSQETEPGLCLMKHSHLASILQNYLWNIFGQEIHNRKINSAVRCPLDLDWFSEKLER